VNAGHAPVFRAIIEQARAFREDCALHRSERLCCSIFWYSREPQSGFMKATVAIEQGGNQNSPLQGLGGLDNHVFRSDLTEWRDHKTSTQRESAKCVAM
jgi:hypothetical protein